MNQSVSILERFHHRGFPYTIQGSTIVVGAKIDVLLDQNKDLSDEDKVRVKELSGRLDNPSKYAQYLIRYYEEKDIVELINEFEKKFKRFDQKDINKYDILELRDTLRLASKTKTEIKKEGTEKVFENDEAIVLKINTKEASCYYGAGTKWCISAREENLFGMHHENSNIYFVLSKKLPQDDPLYKVAVIAEVDGYDLMYYDSLDDTIEFSDIKDFDIPKSVFEVPDLNEIDDRILKPFYDHVKNNVFKGDFTLTVDFVHEFDIYESMIAFDLSAISFKGKLDCRDLGLSTFENFPHTITELDVSHNNFTVFEGIPKIDTLDISYNKIESLEGLPKKLKTLNIYNNPGNFTEEEVRAICRVKLLKV